MNDQISQQIQRIKILVVAIAGGLIAFSVITFVLVSNGMVTPGEDAAKLLTIMMVILCSLALGEVVAYYFIRNSIVDKIRTAWRGSDPSKGDDDKIVKGFSTITIIGCAMVEGLGLFGAIIGLITGNLYALIVSVVAVVFLIFQFPTGEKVRAFKATIAGRL